MEECCGKCKFSKPIDAESDVVCRRFPPVPLAGKEEKVYFHFPRLNPALGWCGEFRPAVTQ